MGRASIKKGAAEPLVLPAVPTVRAVEYIRRLRGASQPCLMRGDDGRIYVVKFQNNPQHVRVLANEMLAARLGCLMGLPVPDPAVVEGSRRAGHGQSQPGIPDWFPPRTDHSGLAVRLTLPRRSQPDPRGGLPA